MVEEHRPAHLLTQRRFDVASPTEPPGEPRVPAVEPPSGSEPPPDETPRGPSDTALRERQLRWLKERDRFVAAQERESAPPPG